MVEFLLFPLVAVDDRFGRPHDPRATDLEDDPSANQLVVVTASPEGSLTIAIIEPNADREPVGQATARGNLHSADVRCLG